MNRFAVPAAARVLLVVLLACAGCTSTATFEGPDPAAIAAVLPEAETVDVTVPETPANETSSEEGTAEVSIAVAETEHPEAGAATDAIDEVVVGGVRGRHQVIRDLVTEGQQLLRDVKLEYFFTGKGRRETLRGRPVVFALWSDSRQEWTVAHIEIPREGIQSPTPDVSDVSPRSH